MTSHEEFYLDELPQSSKEILSVSDLNQLAKTLLEENFSKVVVEGEISNIAVPNSGHWYLTLKDKKSQIRCAMFTNRNRFVRFEPKNGNFITAKGKLSIYGSRGDYQLIIESMEEAGEGALKRAFEELKYKLLKEGLFAQELKQPVSSYYGHIGIITSRTGAALQDILSVFSRRSPATKLTLLPVSVQGKESASEIAHAIQLANTHKEQLGLEALIISRGGGSLEDLQAFNEEKVARAISTSELPITSAVGHEVDYTIADFTADLRAPTPSAAAEIMSTHQDDYHEHLTDISTRLKNRLKAKMIAMQERISLLKNRLKSPSRKLQEHAQDLDRLENQILLLTKNQFVNKQREISFLRQSLLGQSPKNKIKWNLSELNTKRNILLQSLRNSFERKKSALVSLSRGLETVSPLSTLERGYSITFTSQSAPIKSADRVKVGDRIRSHLYRGNIESVVSKIEINKG
ncbi:MAG: exodeoxyribonuclease VII large subunit [Pseudohongiellaceae bacterium]